MPCRVCEAYRKATNAYLEAMKTMEAKYELDQHLIALSDITRSREIHLVTHADGP